MKINQTTFFSKRLRADEGGNIAIISAAFMLVAVAACAFAVDLGSLYLQRRTEQGAVDLAAIAAAADLSRPEAAARATLAANGVAQISAATRPIPALNPASASRPGNRLSMQRRSR